MLLPRNPQLSVLDSGSLLRKLPPSQPLQFYTASGRQWVIPPVIFQNHGLGAAGFHMIVTISGLTTANTKNKEPWHQTEGSLQLAFHQSPSYPRSLAASQHSIPAHTVVVRHADFTSIFLPHKAFSVHLNVKFPSALSKPKLTSILKAWWGSEKLTQTCHPVPTGLSQDYKSQVFWGFITKLYLKRPNN